MRPKPLTKLFRILALALALCLAPGLCLASEEEPRISDPVLTSSEGNLVLYFTLTGAFPSFMEEAILAGTTAEFHFTVILNRVRDLWTDAEIAEISLSHKLSYDPGKKLFTVVRSELPGDPFVTHSFPEAKEAMSDIDRLVVCPLTALSKGANHQIKFKAIMDKVDPPLYLRYALPFLALWDFETDWYTIDFTY